jgi:hypothetical protein
LGSILSTGCVLLFGNGPALARELGVPMRELARPLAGWFWRMILAGAAACLIGSAAAKAGLAVIALAGSSAAAIYLALMFPVVFKSSLRPYIAPRVAALRARWRGLRLAEGRG